MSENNPQDQQNLQNNQQIQIKATDEKLGGDYSNMMQVSHNKEEFVLDFMSVFPPSGSLVARILVSPAHAKRIMLAMQENIQRYEAQFEKIDAADDSKPQFGFKTQ